MKKTLFLLSIIAFSTHCKDALHEAIKEINVQAAKEYLLINPISEQDKEIYLYLLEQRMKDLDNEIFFNKFIPIFHSVYPMLACIGAFVSTKKVRELYKNYNYYRDGIQPMAIASTIVVVTLLCWYKANNEEAQYNKWMEQAPIDALKIKQLIISA